MPLTDMEQAEIEYWHSVVSNYMRKQEDWRYPEEAIESLLDGTLNQRYISGEIKYPVLRWRELNGKLKVTKKKQ